MISLNASRTIEEPSAVDSSFYESEFFGLSWNHALNSKLVFDSYAKVVDDDYDIDRQDQYVDWGLGLDYVWRDWMTAGIYYGEIERTSTLDNVDYDENYFGIRLKSDLRSFLKGRRHDDLDPWSFGKPARTRKIQ